jgi:hypothetical protein
MLSFSSALSGALIPPVDPADLKRVWSLMSRSRSEMPGQGGTASISTKLFVTEIEAGSDVIAVSLRTTLIDALLAQGMLEEWREGEELRDIVFWNAATFPLANGLKEFDASEFMKKLKKTQTL